MRRRTSIAIALVGLELAMAHSGPSAQNRTSTKPTVTKRTYDTKELVTKSQALEPTARGRALWVQRCAYCHDGVGTPTYKTLGPWIDAETVGTPDGEAFVRQQIANGSARMPGFRYGLQQEQVDQIIAFLKSVTPDQRPTAEQLAKSPPTEAPTQ